MGLWESVISEGLEIEETTEKTKAFLESVTLQNLRDPALWRKLRTLVLVTPQEDISPVRTECNEITKTIGVNALTTKGPLWFTLADCVVSKLLSGKCPQIEKAQGGAARARLVHFLSNILMSIR